MSKAFNGADLFFQKGAYSTHQKYWRYVIELLLERLIFFKKLLHVKRDCNMQLVKQQDNLRKLQMKHL